MRIAIDYSSAVLQGAGIGRYTRNLIAALAELDQQTQYILFSSGSDAHPTALPPSFARRELPFNNRYVSKAWQRVKLLFPIEIFTGKVDIFHSPDFVLPPVLEAIKVLTIHDLSFLRLPHCSSPGLLRYLLANVPPSVRKADYLLADSQSTRNDLIELLGVAPERISVVYAGYDPAFQATPTERDAAILQRYGVDGPYILGVGTLQPRKNYTTLIRAYHQLVHERHIPHRLVIAGDKGWLYDDIFSAVDELGLCDRVIFAGYVADADLPSLYRGAAVFAFPSLYEGFGIPILEALGCGTPVVTANVSSLPEVAGDAALYVDPSDTAALAEAIWRILDDTQLALALRARGFERLPCFTWQKAAQALLDVYQQAYQRKDGG